MLKDTKNTPFEAPKSERSQQISLINSFEKLENTKKALFKLKHTSHLVYGVKNVLFNLDEEIEEKLAKISHLYLHLLKRKADLQLQIEDIEKDNNQKQADNLKNTIQALDIAIKEERHKISPTITKSLLESFTEAFSFLINHLDDHRLKELKIDITQRDIAKMLYEHIESYESLYALGKTLQLELAPKIREMAVLKNKEVFENIVEVLTIGRPYLEHMKPRKRVPTISGLGEEEGENEKEGEIKSKIPTIIPKPFIPQSEEEIRAGAENVFSLSNFKDNKLPSFQEFKEEIVPVAETIKRPTLMYPGVMPKPIGGVIPSDLSEQEKEVLENSDRISQEISILPKAKLPDLTGLFSVSDDEEASKEKINNLTIPTRELVESLVSEETPEKLNQQEIKKTDTQIQFKNIEEQAEKSDVDSQMSTDVSRQQQTVEKQEISRTFLMPSEKLIKRTTENLGNIVISNKANVDIISKNNAYRYKQDSSLELIEKTETESQKVSFWDKTKAKAKKHWKGLVMAGSLLLGGLALHGASQNTENQKITDDTTENSVKNNEKEVKNMPKIVEKNIETRKNTDEVEELNDKDRVPVEEAKKEERDFASVIKTSKSPIVQKIINQGEFNLSNKSVIDTMIGSFRGLANAEQVKQLDQLQRQINLALSVFYNEHFGTPEKMAESMQDLKMRNLYRTVKIAQQKGWVNKNLTKSEYPKSYQFAKQILEDSSELGIDMSDNQQESVQNFVNGNMFQAKFTGNKVKVKKENGKYHIIQELVFDIFENKNINDHFDKVLASVDKSVLQNNNIVPSDSDSVTQDNRLGQIEKNTVQMGAKSNQFSIVDTSEIDSEWNSIFAKKYQNDQELNEINANWDNIFVEYENKRNHQNLEKTFSSQLINKELEKIDAGWDLISTQQDINHKLNTVVKKSDLDKELEEIDAGWDLA